ncbi:MATE family multidrug resistance protein [Pseudorhizobium tarimense]|uniref:Multidrug-efflux transporter n=1 Tax=Pseudorhizobium tarimense TaxID=1079109 RepID=A0ABV2H735_9HYPH|nr:MATE family efflux transporter [Pseudorhizobium tarimense]MCJ8519307.1 MATE family efflux transporter [Pseudorhizobium tarimense]
MSSAAIDTVAANNSWGRHVRSTIGLGVPFVGAQLAQMAINTTDVIMVGWLGTTELAAVVLGSQMFFIVFIFGTGFAAAVVPMVAHAVGRGDVTSVRRAVRMGMWVALGYGALTAPILWFSQPILLALGQEQEVAALARGYLRIAQWGIFPALVLMVLRSFLSGLERGSIILYVTIGMFFANAGLNYALIFGNFGLPAWGLQGAAVASVCASTLGCVAMIIYIGSQMETKAFELFVRFWRADWGAIRENLALGLPISFTILAETSLFAAASLLIGTIGTRELAAHGIALQLASIAFMIPLGLAQVATVRVGLAYGRDDMVGVRRAAIAVLAVSLCFSICGSTLFALLPRELGGLFLDTRRADAQAVLDYAISLIVIAGVFQMADGLQAVGAGLLRGLKDTKIPMMLALVAYWPIGFACAWIFAFPLGYGGPGVWFGFVTGLGAAALLLCGRFYRLVRQR